jgi:hypothetical protein
MTYIEDAPVRSELIAVFDEASAKQQAPSVYFAGE